MNEQNPHYFASANTTEGFVSFFPRVFDPDRLKRIFIIKGGPGTGKSSLMHRVARLAADAGSGTEFFHCSSDPDSLDAVLFPEKEAAILDGTSPHTTDPKYPGAVEEIVDTGAFWDPKKLAARKKEILALVRQKGEAFRRAYRCLGAAGVFLRSEREIALSSLLTEKIDGAAERAAAAFSKARGSGKASVRLVSSFSHKGYRQGNAFEEASDSVIVVRDKWGEGTAFLDRLDAALQRAGVERVKSFSCLYPESLNGVLIPRAKTAFLLAEDPEKEFAHPNAKTLNMQRFLDRASLSLDKEKLRFLKKCASGLKNEAQKELKEAFRIHLDLEKIYIGAMDFKKSERLAQRIAKEIGF